MGAGNWYPSVNRGDRDNYELLYIDTGALYGPEDTSDDAQISYDEFESNVLSCLPKSFEKVNKHRHHGQPVLAENKMFECLVHDNTWGLAVAFIVKEWSPKFAESKLPELGKLVFDRLHKIYGEHARVRNGPWMSGPYNTTTEVQKCTANM